jgi:site-specific recombinase XerD
MPNQQTLLTDAICERAMPEAREYALRDTRQRNLSLRVRPCGAKTWIVRHRPDGHSVRVSVGTYPEMGIKKARDAASAVLGGQAPAPQPMLLFGTFCAEHERRYAQALKPSGLRTYRTYVRTQLLPAFGKKPLATLTRTDVVRWFERYSATSPGGANRALGILGQMLECAKRWGRLSADWINPVVGIRHNRRRAVGTFLSKPQMARLGAVLASRHERGCTASAVLTALLLTGCRVGEMVELQWGDVSANRLRLRDSKTGARDVPLGAAARRFLATHGHRQDSKLATDAHVFPVGYERVRTVWRNVRAAAGLPHGIRIHDLRHSFASHAIMAGESLFTVSRLLGHRRVQTTARYAHLADDAMLDGAERIGALIMKQALPSPRPSVPTRAIDHGEATHV